jgi:hypothetical protein
MLQMNRIILGMRARIVGFNIAITRQSKLTELILRCKVTRALTICEFGQRK